MEYAYITHNNIYIFNMRKPKTTTKEIKIKSSSEKMQKNKQSSFFSFFFVLVDLAATIRTFENSAWNAFLVICTVMADETSHESEHRVHRALSKRERFVNQHSMAMERKS